MATYDLSLVQGQRLQRGLRWTRDGVAQTLAGYDFKAQIRAKETASSALLLDLTPYISLNADGVTFDLVVPATVTAALEPKAFKDTASWDMFLWPTGAPGDAFLFVQGSASLDPSTTDMT